MSAPSVRALSALSLAAVLALVSTVRSVGIASAHSRSPCARAVIRQSDPIFPNGIPRLPSATFDPVSSCSELRTNPWSKRHFHQYGFTASHSGCWEFTTETLSFCHGLSCSQLAWRGSGNDTTLALYQGTFDPASPCTHLLYWCDTGLGGGTGGSISTQLDSGDYVLVVAADNPTRPETSYQLEVIHPDDETFACVANHFEGTKEGILDCSDAQWSRPLLVGNNCVESGHHGSFQSYTVQNTAGPALWHFDTYNGPEGHITPALYLYDTTWAAFEPATPCSGDLEAWCEDLGSGCSFDHQLESDHIYRLVATTYWDYDDGPYRVSYSTNGGLGAVRTASCPTCPVFPQEDTKERVMPRLWDGDAAYLYNEGRVTVPWYGCASYLIGSPLGVSNADESGRWDAARYPEKWVEVGWVRFGEQAGRVTHPACVDAYCAYEAWRNRNTLFSGGHDFQVDQTSHFMPGDAPSFRVFANAIYDPADITWRGQWSADGVEWHDIPGVEPATFPCGQQMHELFSGVETVGQQPAGNVGLHLHATNMYIGCPQLQLTEWLYSEVLDYGLGPEHWNVTPVGASDWIMTTWP